MIFGLNRLPVVIASEAKQSRSWREELDCFVAFAPRNDDLELDLVSSLRQETTWPTI